MSMADRDDDEVETLSIGSEEEEDTDRGDEVADEEDAEALAAVAAAAGDEGEEEEEESAEGKPGQRIPYPRFREVNEELKAEREARIRLEERLRALEQGKQPEPKQSEPKPDPKAEAPDVKALRRQLRAAIIEGDDDKADEIEEKLEAARKAEVEAIRVAAVEEAKRELQADRERQAAEAVAREARDAAKSIVAEYPALDAASKAANKEAIEDFITIRDRELAKGAAVKQAMQTAATKVAKMHDLAKAGDGEGKPQPKPPASKMRNAEHAARIPPKLSGSSGSATPDPDDLDEEAFEKLPAAEKRRMRGDFVT